MTVGRVEQLSQTSDRRPAAGPRESQKVLILNVRSGSAAATSREVARTVRRAGVEVIEVRRGTDLQLAVRTRLRDGARHFIVGGGDGTLRNVVKALAGSDATLGLIPLGTYNRFARDARLPLAWREALDVALYGRVRPVDVGTVDGSPFLSAVTFGVHAALLQERERLRERHASGLALARAAAAALLAFPVPRLTLEVDGRMEEVLAPVVAVSVNRVTFDGGLPRRVTLSGGTLSAWWLPAADRTTLVAQLGAMLLGNRDGAAIQEVSGRRIVVSGEGLSPAGIDGEATVIKRPLSLRIRERALLVRMN